MTIFKLELKNQRTSVPLSPKKALCARPGYVHVCRRWFRQETYCDRGGNGIWFSWTVVEVRTRMNNHMHINMPSTRQLGGPVRKASGRVQKTPFGLSDKSSKITDQHPAGGSVSQLSQLTKPSPWLTLSTNDITISFWYYNKLFCFLSKQIMGLYHVCTPIKYNLCIYDEM